MSSERKRAKVAKLGEVAPENLGETFKAAFEDAASTQIYDTQEEILAGLPLEEMLAKIDEAKARYGGRVGIRTLENGNVILSPPAKRAREREETVEEHPPPEHSGDEGLSEHSKEDDLDVAAQKKRKMDDQDPPIESELDKDDLYMAAEYKERAIFVESVRVAIRACVPPEFGLIPADMQDVDYQTRYHGLIRPEEPMPVRFKFQRFPAMASFMLPASPLSPYIVHQGDILYFKRTELALPVLECLYGGGKNSYWCVLVYIPKAWRNLIWQDTRKSELPLDQLFRVIALSYVDWAETMRVRGALDAPTLQSALDLWQTISSKFQGDRMPNALKRVITQGLTLSKDATGEESQASGPTDHAKEGNPPNPETGHPDGGKTGDRDPSTKPSKGSHSSTPIIEYQKLYQTLQESKKAITNAITKENNAVKNILKTQSKSLDTLAANITALEASTSATATKFGSKQSTSSEVQGLEAEIRALKGAVHQMSTALKSSEEKMTKMCEKVDMLLQDKSRMTWEEFSQRQRDILSLNKSLAAPMQASMWSQPSSAGPWMNPYMEPSMHTGTSMGPSSYLGSSYVPSIAGQGLLSTVQQVKGYSGPSTGPAGPLQEQSGVSFLKPEEKPTSTANTQAGSEVSTEATIDSAMSEQEILRIIQILKKQNVAPK